MFAGGSMYDERFDDDEETLAAFHPLYRTGHQTKEQVVEFRKQMREDVAFRTAIMKAAKELEDRLMFGDAREQ